jgi:hypothetical protein
VTALLQIGAERLKSPSAQAATPAAVNAADASSATVVMGQTSASAPSAPYRRRGYPEEVVSTEGSAPLRASAGSSQALVRAGGDLHVWEGSILRWADRQNLGATLFTLDDAIEGKDWERVETGVGLTAHVLNTALGALRDVIDPIGQVRPVRAFVLDFSFFGASNLCCL